MPAAKKHMKQTFTISLDAETIMQIRDFARKSSFRNKSHMVEEAVKKFMEDESEKIEKTGKNDGE